MSHPEQISFVQRTKLMHPRYFRNTRVLEVGSLNINGTVREIFNNCDYIGVDIGHGPGVDLVAYGQELQFKDRFFDTVISAECFEHNPYWKETFLNMVRMCKGLVLVTAATDGRAEHGTSTSMPHASPLTIEKWNYYRNISRLDLESLPLDEYFDSYEIEIDEDVHDIYFRGLVKDFEVPGFRRFKVFDLFQRVRSQEKSDSSNI